MTSWAQRRQLTIVTIFLGLIAGVIFLSYRSTKPVASCFDGIRNQGERAVDCGSPCARVCPDEATPLSILWSKVLLVERGRYDFAALVENKNPYLSVDNLSFTVKFYDANDILISEKKGSSFSNPKQRFVLFLPNVDTGKRIPARADLSFGEVVWVRVAPNFELPKISVDDKVMVNEPFPRLEATLLNSGLRPVSSLEVLAVLSDSVDVPFAVSRTTVPGFARGERSSAVFTWPESFAKDASIIDIYTRERK